MQKTVYPDLEEEEEELSAPLPWCGAPPGLVQLVRTCHLPAVLAHMCTGLEGVYGGVHPGVVDPGGFWLRVGEHANRVGLSASGLIIRKNAAMPPAPPGFKDIP